MDHNRDSATVAYASLIQTFSRYLLEQMTTESQLDKKPPALVKGLDGSAQRSPLAQLTRLDAKSISTCQSCGVAMPRDTSLGVLDLIYPRKVSRQ